MYTALFSLLVTPVWSATLEVPLGAHVGVVRTPDAVEVALRFAADGEGPEASWSNDDSGAVALACAEQVETPDRQQVTQALLEVGAEKWALQAGAAVKYTCPAGSPITVVDLRGTPVGVWKGSVVMTVAKLKPRSAR